MAGNSSDSPRFGYENHDGSQHIGKTTLVVVRGCHLLTDTFLKATVSSVSRSTISIDSFQSFKMAYNFSLACICTNNTLLHSTHLVSNVILQLIKLLLRNNKTKTWFLFPFGGSVLCKCVCKHSFDSSSQMKRTMCHTSKEIIQPNSLRTHGPHLGQVGSNRKQVIHLFCFA